MKLQIKKILFLFVLGIMVVACNSKEEEQLSIEDLKSVEFTDNPEKIISTKKTGNIVTDPSTSTDRFEYLTTIQKTYLVKPILNVVQMNNDIIFPGSMLRGDTFIKGKYDPLVLSNEFNPVTLSITLQGDVNVLESVKPVLSQVRRVKNDLIAQQKDKIDFTFVPTIYNYESNSVTTEESFKRALKIHVDVNVLKGLVKTNFDYKQDNNTSNTKKYVMVSFRQSLYNVSIDPKHYSEWIKGDINVKDMGEYEPVYVSSVDYGRIGCILVETEKSAREIREMIKASLEFAVGYVDTNINVEYTKEFKKLFKQEKIKVMINGGPHELAGKIDSYDSFKKFVQMPNPQTLVKTSVPISYKVRRLRDNTEVEVRDTYTETIFELKDN